MNVNEYVEVDLNSNGRLVLYKYEIKIGAPVYSPGMTGKRLKIQLWELMHVFGPEMYMGREPCFEGNEIHLPAASPRAEGKETAR